MKRIRWTAGLFVLVLSAVNVFGENVPDGVPADENSPETQAFSQDVRLCEHFSPDFQIGTAVSPFQLRVPELREHILRHFNSLTAENCMKPEAIYRNDAFCDFRQADALVEFAQENGLAVRGHTLVWHSQTPRGFFRDENGEKLSKDALYARLERYMTAVLTHFRGKVYCWDVVNEAISDYGPEIYRTHSPWYEICGKEFIAEAFRMAHRIDPDIRLYYNDYGLISPEKRRKTVEMLRGLLADGVPIHGVGIQAHLNMHYFSPEELQKSIDAFAELGLDVQITELDMSVHGRRPPHQAEEEKEPQKDGSTEEEEALQAERYAQAFEVLRRNADRISSVTFWGISDGHTWLSYRGKGKDFPLLFDAELQPKEAFRKITSPELLSVEMPDGVPRINEDGT